MVGAIKWFNVKNGYDLINCSHTRENIFVHQSAITRNNSYQVKRSVVEGETVEFNDVTCEK